PARAGPHARAGRSPAPARPGSGGGGGAGACARSPAAAGRWSAAQAGPACVRFSAVLPRGDDRPDPPAVLPRGGDLPDPPAVPAPGSVAACSVPPEPPVPAPGEVTVALGRTYLPPG